jgi:hypothetical protein
MKRLFGAMITVLILYSIFYDLSSGTLPTKKQEELAVPVSNTTSESTYFEVVVKPGDTVLSIFERNQKEPIPVSITNLISDFQKLNKGKRPEDIQIGKKYRFPNYDSQ